MMQLSRCGLSTFAPLKAAVPLVYPTGGLIHDLTSFPGMELPKKIGQLIFLNYIPLCIPYKPDFFPQNTNNNTLAFEGHSVEFRLMLC